MGTDKRRISTVVRLEAKEDEAPVLALEVAQVAAERERDPVAAERERGPVAAGLELGRVEAGLELGRVEAGPGRDLAEAAREPVRVEAVAVPGHPRAQLAVPLRIKSVTAVHRRGLVPLLGAEDLAAAAETTRERAAAEAAAAWEAAV